MSDWDGRLLAVDPQICEIVERSESELLRTTYMALTHPDDLPRNISALHGLTTASGPISIEKRYLLPNGRPVWVLANISKFKTGSYSTLVGTITKCPEKPRDDLIAQWQAAKRVVQNSLHRRLILGTDFANDHAYLILLHLYLADSEGRIETLESLAELTKISSSLTARWLGFLASYGYVERISVHQPLPEMTPIGIRKIEQVLSQGSA